MIEDIRDITVSRPNHYYRDSIAVYPDAADGFYIRKAKITPNNNARDILIDLKMRALALDGKRDCERSLYRPLQTGYKTDFVMDGPVEYKTHKPKHQHLYSKYR